MPTALVGPGCHVGGYPWRVMTTPNDQGLSPHATGHLGQFGTWLLEPAGAPATAAASRGTRAGRLSRARRPAPAAASS